MNVFYFRSEMNLNRTNSVCPSPEEILLESVKKNNLNSISTIIESNEDLLKYVYPFPYEKTILPIACSEENTSPETIQLLIDLKANISGDHSEFKPLHLAIQNPNIGIVEVILKNLQPGQINTEILDGNNALHTLIKKAINNDTEDQFVRHVELLLRAGINVNQGDSSNNTPILWAVRKNYKKIIKTILDKSILHVDLDGHKFRNKTARELIIDKNLYDGVLPEKKFDNYDTKVTLFSLIKQSDEEQFINLLLTQQNLQEFVNLDDGTATFLQYSCEKGLKKIVNVLINNGADVNRMTPNNINTPLQIVAENGYFEIFQVLIEQHDLIIDSKILCNLIKKYDNPKFEGINHEICLNKLLDKIESYRLSHLLNEEDSLNNTPIHYSLRYADWGISKKLLNLGSSLACKNSFGFMPIEDIKPENLENHLDDCVKFDLKGNNYEKHDFQVIFDYKNFIPPKTGCKDEENNGFHQDNLGPETEVVFYMSQAPEFKHLLKHPIIVSLLFMKWHKIRWIFYINLLFYILFTLSLIFYIFTYYANFSENESGASRFFYVILAVTFFILIIRESFQVCVSPSSYYNNFENFIEIILIVLIAMILFINKPSEDTRRQLASVSILFAAFELILMLGQHPKLSTNVVMFKTVSLNFFKLLLWYSLLIIAFALSFNILFSNISSETTLNDTQNAEEQEEDVFTGPGKSLFKTIIMLTGEFDAGSINFNTYPVTSKFIFTLFIFMIVIILLNLLNGLAVSDTQTIKNDAELVGHVLRAQHIYYVECMLLGNILPSSLVKLMKSLCCCFPFEENSSYTILKPLVRKILLFDPLLQGDNSQLCVLPNNNGLIYFEFDENRKKGDYSGVTCCKGCSGIFLDKDTVKRTNEVVRRKMERVDVKNDRLEKLYIEQEKLREKLDEILKILVQKMN